MASQSEAEVGDSGSDGQDSGDLEDKDLSPIEPSRKSETRRWSVQLDQADWTPLRKVALKFSESQAVENIMAVLITLNVVLMVWETDLRATCRFSPDHQQGECAPPVWTSMVNFVLLLVYTLEITTHIFAYRRFFFFNPWNYVEMVIVVVGFVDFVLSFETDARFPNLIFLRVFRLFRLLRTIRLMVFFPELYELLRGFAGAAYVMVWGAVLIIIMLGLWSIVAVEVTPTPQEMWEDAYGDLLLPDPPDPLQPHPLPEQCHDVFSSVPKAMLWFFQTLVAGDSWGMCTIPIIKHTPPCLLIFLGALICVELGVTNLILAVIVDAAAGAREKDQEQKLRKKLKEERAGLERWRAMVSEIDRDGSGTISLKELMSGFDGNPEVRRCFQLLDIDRYDLQDFFNLLDHDDSGDLSYSEFFHDLQKAHTQDTRMYLMSLKLQISHITHLLHEQMGRLAKPSRGASPTASPPQSVNSQRNSRTSTGKDNAERGSYMKSTDGPSSDPFFAKLKAQLDQLTEDASAQAAALLQNTQKLEALLASCNIEDPAPRRHQQSRASGPARNTSESQQFSSSSGQQSRAPGAAKAPSENLGPSSGHQQSRAQGAVTDTSESQLFGSSAQGPERGGKNPGPVRIAM